MMAPEPCTSLVARCQFIVYLSYPFNVGEFLIYIPRMNISAAGLPVFVLCPELEPLISRYIGAWIIGKGSDSGVV